ncbi:MAG: hypothetical protein WA160_04935 [Pseudobdellovibrio sp.]
MSKNRHCWRTVLHFDLVIDSCGYHPQIVKKSCEFLEDQTSKYVFISTGSVYSDFSKPGLNENSKCL